MKKLPGALAGLSLALCLCMSGCAGTTADSHLGKYVGYALSIPGLGDPEPIEATYDEGENYVELKEDGAAVVCLDGDPIDATYALDGEAITITMTDSGDAYDSEGTLKDGVLTFDVVGIGFELTFVKEGAPRPFEVVEGGIASGMTGDEAEERSVALDVSVADDDTAAIRVTAKETYLGDPALALTVTNKTERNVTVAVAPDAPFMVAGAETEPYLSKELSAGETAYGVYLWWSSNEVVDLEALADVAGTLVVSDTDTGEELARYELAV